MVSRSTRAASATALAVLVLWCPPPVAGADPGADAAPDPVVVDGVPHLPSPDHLPPGTTDDAPPPRPLGYLRDLWHAVRTHDVTMGDALLLIAQRPMDARVPLSEMSPRPAPDAPPADPPPAAPPVAPSPGG